MSLALMMKLIDRSNSSVNFLRDRHSKIRLKLAPVARQNWMKIKREIGLTASLKSPQRQMRLNRPRMIPALTKR